MVTGRRFTGSGQAVRQRNMIIPKEKNNFKAYKPN